MSRRMTGGERWGALSPHGAIQANKLREDSPDFDNYLNNMLSNTDRKARFFAESLLRRQQRDCLGASPILIVVDLCGCSGGLNAELIKNNQLAMHHYTAVDLSHGMLLAGVGDFNGRRILDDGTERENHFVMANACFIPMRDNSVDNFLMSSGFHEVYSYELAGEHNTGPFSTSNIDLLMEEAYRALKPGGEFVIRDPAKPEKPNELLYLQLPRGDGYYPTNRDELMRVPPGDLSTHARLFRFLSQFKPAQELLYQNIVISDDTVLLPAWVISEFARHGSPAITDTPEHFADECREHYGVFTVNEMIDFSRRHGFLVDSDHVHNGTNSDNHAAVFMKDKMRVFDGQGKEVNTAERFPTQIYAILQKPYHDDLDA